MNFRKKMPFLRSHRLKVQISKPTEVRCLTVMALAPLVFGTGRLPETASRDVEVYTQMRGTVTQNGFTEKVS